MELDYKNALITGASSGLGRGLAAWFAKRGVTVYAAARREDELHKLKAEVGDRVVPVQLDVADADAAHDRIQAIDRECGGLDLVVANAGVAGRTYAKHMDWKLVKRILDVNVEGAAATLCAPLPGMVERGRGHLVGVSSLAAFVTVPRMAAYGASKTFLSSFLDALRQDVERLGLHVTRLNPGYVKTDLTAGGDAAKMPFLMEVDDAVEEMAKAIVAKARVHAFPWQLSTPLRTLNSLPRPLSEAIARRVT